MPTFEHARSITIDAPPDAVRALVADLHAWTQWSPWEGLDGHLTRAYAGPGRGPGARYEWSGKKSGQGSMLITEEAADHVALDLDFVKPFKASNKVVFRFEPEGPATRVTWTMSGTRGLLLALLGKLAFDSMIRKDFDKGLARLKAAANG